MFKPCESTSAHKLSGIDFAKYDTCSFIPNKIDDCEEKLMSWFNQIDHCLEKLNVIMNHNELTVDQRLYQKSVYEREFKNYMLKLWEMMQWIVIPMKQSLLAAESRGYFKKKNIYTNKGK